MYYYLVSVLLGGQLRSPMVSKMKRHRQFAGSILDVSMFSSHSKALEADILFAFLQLFGDFQWNWTSTSFFSSKPTCLFGYGSKGEPLGTTVLVHVSFYQ